MGRRWVSVGVLGVLLLSGASAARAREIAKRSFEGKGWNQSELAAASPLAVSFAGVSRGSISFDLQRSGDAAGRETVFALLDPAGIQVLRLRVSWTSASGQRNPEFSFRGPGSGEEYRRYGMGLWGPVVELDRPVAHGTWIHVDLTWDDTSRIYTVYVDGRAQLKQSGGYQPGKLFSAEMLERFNRELEREGKLKAFDSRPLNVFLSEVVAVQFGSSGPPLPTVAGARTPPPGKTRPSLRNALLDNFIVYGDEIPLAGRTRPVAAPAIASVEHDAARTSGFSGKLVAGNTLRVTMDGTPGATGTFDVAHYPDLGGKITLDWRGWGVYLEDKAFFEENEVDLREVEGYRVYASTAPFDAAAPGLEPRAELAVGVQSYTCEFLDADTPYYLAVVARMRNGTTRTVVAPIAHRPLTEAAPGSYAGTYQAGWMDHYPRAVAVGRLATAGGAAALIDPKPFAIDPGLNIAVVAEPNVLKADEVSKAKVSVTVTDANGNPVSGHKLKFVLATTSQYTGVVGGGDFADQVGGKIAENRWLETDLFGKAEVMYLAGFAAKTAIIVARDMVSNSTGSGWVRTYIQATAQLELEPVQAAAAMAAGCEITVASSDDWLTADGKSQARITARVTCNDRPAEGHRVEFAVSSGAGTIRAVKETTDRNGEARAVYTAGKKIGIALVTATDTTAGISGTVPIELRSDAPAKIAVRVDPDKLPADGRSRAELSVLVTDINNNPNDNVEVEYQIAGGSGSVRDDKKTTDRRGESATQYTAGRSAGTVTFEITVRSTAPNEAELEKARELAVAVTDHTFF